MTATPKHSIWSLCLILITALLTGCASTVGITDDKPNGFAYVEIEGSHQALIKAGAIQVFSQEEGFKVVSDSGNQVRFTKPGTKVSFCGLKCTTFLRFKVYHPEEVFLFSLRRRFVERDLLVGSCFL